MNPAYLATIVLLLVHLCSFTPTSLAQSERGHKGAIDKKTMLSIFEAGKNDPQKGWVDGYVLEGNDLIEIIKQENCSVRITNSIINGGIDFTQLPTKTIDEIEKPLHWKPDEWQDWVNDTRNSNLNIHIVNNLIDINYSQINDEINTYLKKNKSIIFFCNSFNFYSNDFKNNVYFGNSVFASDSDFNSNFFNGYTDFHDVTFYGDTVFMLAKFNGHTEYKKTSIRDRVGSDIEPFIANFKGVVFNNSGNFYMAKFSEEVNFTNITFNGLGYFNQVEFSSDAIFKNSAFNGVGDFHLATFGQDADFGGGHIR